MEVKKILRKATALAASASFIGATLLGAVAQDLAQYPAPFVKDGMFDAFIVVGADAQPMDVVGAVDVGTSLQFALKKATTISAGAAEATIDNGVKIVKSGNKFNYGDSINTVQAGTTIAEEDLPFVLADGKFTESEGDNKNSETYTQTLMFNEHATANLTYHQDNDLAPVAGDYLMIKKNDELYNYTLEFDDTIEYTNTSSTTASDDLKTSTLTIQGKTYTITDVTASAGLITKLTLLSGEAVLWLTQNNPITKTVSGVEHTIEVLDVTEAEDACQVKVDDVTAIIDEDNTKTINGVQIGITDVRAIHAQLQDVDVCQVSVGASEVVLEDGQEIKVDDVDVDGSKAYIEGIASGGLNAIRVTLTPKGDTMPDTVFLAPGKEYIDPIFSSWKIVYGGLSADYETYSAKTSGDDDATFTFINNDGKEVEIPLHLKAAPGNITLGTGDGIDEKMYAAGANTSITQQLCTGTSSIEECEGMYILATTTGGEAHVFELTSIDVDDNQTDIKDVTYGKTFDNVDFTSTTINATSNGTTTLLDLGSFGNTINISFDETNFQVKVIGSISTKIETNAGGSIDIDDDHTDQARNITIAVSEANRAGGNDIADELASAILNISAQPNADSEIVLNAQWALAYGAVQLEDDSDYTMRTSRVGSIAKVDTENGKSVVLQLAKAEVYGNVFIAPIVAQVSTAAGGATTYTLSKLNVGAAKLDSEISSVADSNLIVVGGPCANRIAAQVLGVSYPACGAASGIAQDTAIIKEVAQAGGKVALVVAGWEAADTRRATRVLANYDTYELSGSMVEVTGTSMTDIQVKKSA